METNYNLHADGYNSRVKKKINFSSLNEFVIHFRIVLIFFLLDCSNFLVLSLEHGVLYCNESYFFEFSTLWQRNKMGTVILEESLSLTALFQRFHGKHHKVALNWKKLKIYSQRGMVRYRRVMLLLEMSSIKLLFLCSYVLHGVVYFFSWLD